MMHTMLHIRSNGQITLPAAIRREANLKDGDLLEVVAEADGSLKLIPHTTIPKDQEYFWTSRWQTGERDAESDIKAGRVKKFDDVNEAITWLDRDR